MKLLACVFSKPGLLVPRRVWSGLILCSPNCLGISFLEINFGFSWVRFWYASQPLPFSTQNVLKIPQILLASLPFHKSDISFDSCRPNNGTVMYFVVMFFCLNIFLDRENLTKKDILVSWQLICMNFCDRNTS